MGDGKVDWNRWNKPQTGWGQKDYDWTDAHTVPTDKPADRKNSVILLGVGIAFSVAAMALIHLHESRQSHANPAPPEPKKAEQTHLTHGN